MSEPLPAPAASNTFERIKRVNSAGADFWSARELARVLEYTDFRNFIAVITKAREACANSGHSVADHFVEITEMVSIGSGAQRPVEDWTLSAVTNARFAPLHGLPVALFPFDDARFTTQIRALVTSGIHNKPPLRWASVCGSAAGRSAPAAIRQALFSASAPLSPLADPRPKPTLI